MITQYASNDLCFSTAPHTDANSRLTPVHLSSTHPGHYSYRLTSTHIDSPPLIPMQTKKVKYVGVWGLLIHLYTKAPRRRDTKTSVSSELIVSLALHQWLDNMGWGAVSNASRWEQVESFPPPRERNFLQSSLICACIYGTPSPPSWVLTYFMYPPRGQGKMRLQKIDKDFILSHGGRALNLPCREMLIDTLTIWF